MTVALSQLKRRSQREKMHAEIRAKYSRDADLYDLCSDIIDEGIRQKWENYRFMTPSGVYDDISTWKLNHYDHPSIYQIIVEMYEKHGYNSASQTAESDKYYPCWYVL